MGDISSLESRCVNGLLLTSLSTITKIASALDMKQAYIFYYITTQLILKDNFWNSENSNTICASVNG